jgi:hypothetical protein
METNGSQMAVVLIALRFGRRLSLPSLPKKTKFSISGTHSGYRLSKHKILVPPQGFGKLMEIQLNNRI